MKNRITIKLLTTLGRGRIGRRLVIATVLFSSFITLSTTCIQLYANYTADLKAINGSFSLIEESYIASISRSVWMYDTRQIEAQLDGLTKLPDMENLEIRAGEQYTWASGVLHSRHTITKRFPLRFTHGEQTFTIGELTATAGLDNVYSRLIHMGLTILATNAIRAFFVSGFILLIFQFLVTRHLIELADHVRKIDLEKPLEPLTLSAKAPARGPPDEIDQVVHAINESRAKLQHSFEALRNSEDELFRIFSMSIDMICIADINTATFIKVNPAFTETLGFSEEELTSRPFLELIHPDDQEKTRSNVEEKLKQGEKVLNFENRYLCKDGSYRWLRWVSHPLPDKGLTYAVAHDVTEIKSSIRDLEQAHQRFLTVLDAIDAHIYVADLDSHEILFMNTKMIRDFGRDFTGETCWSTLQGESGPCRNCTSDKLLDADGKPAGLCVEQGRNPVTGRWHINHDRAIQWVDQRIVRIRISVDITRLKAMEEELRQSHKMEAIGTLAGGIAHDFNNILGIIIGNAELAIDDIPDWNPARSYIGEIKTASLRAKEVVRQLLSFSRKSEHERKPLKLSGIVRESVQLLRASLPAAIDIRTDIRDNACTILADPTQIQQIIINLCTNSAQAMEEKGGELVVGLGRMRIEPASREKHPEVAPGMYVLLAVRDTGEGIAPEIQERIFDPYFTTRDVGKGSGMGLAIVHGIVKNHGGVISVESAPGKGTVVKILFPSLETTYEEKGPALEELPKGTESILFVDDEEQISKMTGRMLERLGYAVETRTDPQEALSLFESAPQRFDLVITDMTMPRLSGRQLAEKMMDVRSDVPVIICTGHSPHIDEEKADMMGIAAYVSKPIMRDEIARTIRSVLDGEAPGAPA